MEKKDIRILIMLDILYYHYYWFYSKVLKDNEPHLLTTLALSFSQMLLMSYSIDFIGTLLFCQFILNKWGMLSVLGSIIIINYLIYHRGSRARNVIKNADRKYRRKTSNAIVTIIFFLFTTSLLFWFADYLLWLMSKC